MYIAVTTICLLYMTALVLAFVIKYARGDREDRLKFLKSFKMGKFVLIYFAAVPLYFLANYYTTGNGTGAFFTALKSGIEIVVLKFDYERTAVLMEAMPFYRATLDICFILVAVNAVMLTLTLIARRGTNAIRRCRATKGVRYCAIADKLAKAMDEAFKCKTKYRDKLKSFREKHNPKVYVIVGYSKENEQILNSVKREKNACALLLSEEEDELLDKLFVEKHAFYKYSYSDDLGAVITKLFGKKLNNKTVNVIVNTDEDSRNLVLVKELTAIFTKDYIDSRTLRSTNGINVFVFGNPEYSSDFVHFAEQSNGIVHYINKYRLVAMDFEGKYPLTEYMTSAQLDYKTATLDKTEVNVVYVGFGKTAQQLFQVSVANNQFVTFNEDKQLVDKPVHYFIYDKKESKNDKNLNHNYFRFEKELEKLKLEKEDYLPLPACPSDEHFPGPLDINDGGFYDSIRSDLSGKFAYNYLIVAFGNDLENLDFAEKLSAKLVEWDLKKNTKLFVKIRDGKLSDNVVSEFAKRDGFIVFGNEDKVVYDVKQIVSEKNERIARDRHLCYAIEEIKEGVDENAAEKAACKKWFTDWKQVQRESNIYACLSLRFKLQLMGYDAVPATAQAEDASEKFFKAYQLGDVVTYKKGKDGGVLRINGKSVVDYGVRDFKRGTLRNNLVAQEHQRWNAYMLANGYVPATKKEIIACSKQELIGRRLHRNLTTYDGLLTYRDMMAEAEVAKAVREGKIKADDEAAKAGMLASAKTNNDVIVYDYQLLDDVVWLLERNGMKIIEKA